MIKSQLSNIQQQYALYGRNALKSNMLLIFHPLFGLLMTSEIEKRKSENKTKWAEEHFYKALAADFDPLELDVIDAAAEYR